MRSPAGRRLALLVESSIPPPVADLIRQVGEERVRADTFELVRLMARVTGEEPVVWNSNTIGFGRYHYRYSSGQEGEFFDIGFAPRKGHLTLYVMSGLAGFEDVLSRLGPHTSTKATVRIKRLDDVERSVLEELVRECVAHLRRVEGEMGAIPRMSDIPPRTSPA